MQYQIIFYLFKAVIVATLFIIIHAYDGMIQPLTKSGKKIITGTADVKILVRQKTF